MNGRMTSDSSMIGCQGFVKYCNLKLWLIDMVHMSASSISRKVGISHIVIGISLKNGFERIESIIENVSKSMLLSSFKNKD
jgi:hypothetical protein